MTIKRDHFRDFSQLLWKSDLEKLKSNDRLIAEKVFLYAVENLKSRPFHRQSARNRNRSDNHHIFKTKSADSFWGLINISKGQLSFHFPDKYNKTKPDGEFASKPRKNGQGKNKKEKEILLSGKLEKIDQFIPMLEEIHANAVDYYGRVKNSTEKCLNLFGKSNSNRYPKLITPENQIFSALISNSPYCRICKSNNNISIYYDKAENNYRLYCDNHHPNQSIWATIGKKCIPLPVREYVWHRDGGKCLKCQSDIQIQFDHIIPQSFGGSNTENNIQLKCRSCNLTKGNKLII
jgi:hypothetical protein